MTEIAGLPVVFQSPHEIVVTKPAGMATELSSDLPGLSAIEKVRRNGYPAARLPHRLDRISRGLLVVALTREAIAHHNAQIRAGNWAKWYLGRIEAPSDPRVLLGRHRAYLKTIKHRAEIVRSGGRPSFLEVLDCAPAPSRPGEAHILIRLQSGRFHQIRAMSADLGFPIAGDPLYGARRDVARLRELPPEVPEAGHPYLEHAALRFQPLSEVAPRVVFERADPGREPIAPSLIESLLRAIALADRESLP